jgi:hypothetical protein
MPSYRQRFAAGPGRQGSQKSGKVVQKEKGGGSSNLLVLPAAYVVCGSQRLVNNWHL